MVPRLVFFSLLLLVLGGAGYGGFRMLANRQPLPRALALLNAHDPQGAQRLLRPVVRAEPRNAEAHVLLARTQLALSDPVAAEKELKIARALHYERTIITPLLARSYMLQERYQDLLADIPGLAPRDDEMVVNLVARSAAYIAMGDLQQAQVSLDGAVRLLPDDPAVTMGQLRMAVAQADFNRAKGIADRVLAGSPENREAWMLKGQALAQHGENEAALEAMNQAVAAAPTSVSARVQRAEQMMRMGRDADAQADLVVATQIDGHNDRALMMNVLLMVRAKKLADAANEFQKLQGSFERHPEGYYYQAQVASMLDQNASALETVMRFLKLRPADRDGLRLAAQLQLRLDYPDRVVAMLTQAIGKGLADPVCFDLLGRAYFVLGERQLAIEAYRHAATLEPENKDFVTHLAAAQTPFGEAPAAPVAVPAQAGTAARP